MPKQKWKPGNMLYPLPAVLVSCGDKNGNTERHDRGVDRNDLLRSGHGLCIYSEKPLFSPYDQRERPVLY